MISIRIPNQITKSAFFNLAIGAVLLCAWYILSGNLVDRPPLLSRFIDATIGRQEIYSFIAFVTVYFLLLGGFILPLAFAAFFLESRFVRVTATIYLVYAIVQHDPTTPGLSVILALEYLLVAISTWSENPLNFINLVSTVTLILLAICFGIIGVLWMSGNFVLVPEVKWFLGFQNVKLDTSLAYISMFAAAYTFLYLMFVLTKSLDYEERSTSHQYPD